MDPAGTPALQGAIRHLHGVEAKHVATTPVHETHESSAVWKGDVETFDIMASPRRLTVFRAIRESPTRVSGGRDGQATQHRRA
jgi:hypothetical protein